MINFVLVIAIALVIGAPLFLAQTLRGWPAGNESDRRKRWRLGFRIALAVLLLVILVTGIWGFLIEPNRLVVNHSTIQINNWPKELSGLRIALIGDVHTGSPFIDDQKLERIVALTNQQNPDLIVLLGDFTAEEDWPSHRVEPEITAAHLKNLRAPLGVYSVLGNHDWWYNGAKVGHAFEQNGIPILENEVTELIWRGRSIWLVGLADLWTRQQHISETLAKTPAGSTVIAITHNPDTFQRLPPTVPLLLAAHTHGGQVNFPLFGTPIVPSRFGRKYTAGHVFENEHHLFVTTGIGTSIIPVRFRVPPEIMILTVNTR